MNRFLPRRRTHACILFLCLIVAGLPLFACRDADIRQPRTIDASPSTDSLPRININTASSEELQRLPGIGPNLALKIIEHRNRHGGFRRPEHLLIVDGMSERRFRAVSQYIATD